MLYLFYLFFVVILAAPTHKKFEEKFGGKVFIVFSIKKDNKKEIYNSEVIEEIRTEIERLKRDH